MKNSSTPSVPLLKTSGKRNDRTAPTGSKWREDSRWWAICFVRQGVLQPTEFGSVGRWGIVIKLWAGARHPRRHSQGCWMTQKFAGW
jgi:hypothetical protein